jgi:DNA/RNA endonuclease YhcR with UshA esterase domain
VNRWEPSSGDGWGGRPIARRIADAGARQRVVVTGKVVEVQRCIWRGSAAQAFGLDDGTGRLTIVFGGLRSIPGMVEGAQCTVEGTALADERGIVLWNPLYHFEP